MLITIIQYAGGSFTSVGVIDYASSIIWTKRFNDAGFFELYLKADAATIAKFRGEIFLRSSEDDTLMYVEKVEITTDLDEGSYITVSGRSAECLLERRIVYPQWNFSGTVENGIRELLTENVISPSASSRRMPFVVLGAANGWTDTMQKQVMGQDLLTVVKELCKAQDYGFRFDFNGQTLTFELYKGTNRSYSQSANPYVVFSPAFENLANTEYSEDKSKAFNYAYVGGEGEGTARTVVILGYHGTASAGLYLCEKWIDSRNTSSNNGGISQGEYMSLLYQQANEALNGSGRTVKTFSGELLDSGIFMAGVDYGLGDTIQIENEFGITGTAVVEEMNYVEDATGFRTYPTLSEWSV